MKTPMPHNSIRTLKCHLLEAIAMDTRNQYTLMLRTNLYVSENAYASIQISPFQFYGLNIDLIDNVTCL